MGTNRIMGAVLAGGRSTRFGSDKALAQLDGHTLLELAVERLQCWCEAVVVIGREAAPAACVADWPRPGMGPLGGMAGALREAREKGFQLLLTSGVDSLGLPEDLPALLAPAPAYVSDQPVVGLWPVRRACEAAELLLGVEGRHSMRSLAEAVGARAVALAAPTANVNTPADLAALSNASRA